MATTLPLPVRIAAGMLATGLDRLRRLPQELPAMSVTVAGQAARLSMRVQQEITELAGRGDELLSGITSHPTERPEWATFDDEDGGADAHDGPTAGAEGATAAGATAVAAATPPTPPAPAAPDAPDMPGYDGLRVAQVRARLHGMDTAAVERLLAHERAHSARAPFVTLLSNRITTLQSDPTAGTQP